MSQGFNWGQYFTNVGGGLDPGSGSLPPDQMATAPGNVDNTGGGFAPPGSGMTLNDDGTWTDPTTGQIYGTPTSTNLPTYGTPDNSGAPSGLSGLASLFSGQNLPLLLGMLGPALGGLLNAHATNQATGQVTAGIGNAQNAVSKLLGTSAFSPYIQAGQGALGRASGMQWQPLNFAPLSGRTLGSLASKKG